MGCDDNPFTDNPSHRASLDRIDELWRLKRRFDAAGVTMDKFTLRESIILHRALRTHSVTSDKCDREELKVLLTAELRIFGDNG